MCTYVHICRAKYLQGCVPQVKGLVFGVAGRFLSSFLYHWIIHALLWISCVATVNKNKAKRLDFVPAWHQVPLSSADPMLEVGSLSFQLSPKGVTLYNSIISHFLLF